MERNGGRRLTLCVHEHVSYAQIERIIAAKRNELRYDYQTKSGRTVGPRSVPKRRDTSEADGR